MEPEDWAERHSPTVLVRNRVSGTRTREAYRQRKADNRLLESLEPHQEVAWAEIATVWHFITCGLTAKAQQYERVDRGRGDPRELSVRLKKQWLIWRNRMPAAERSAIISIICEGFSPFKVSRDRRKGSDWGRRVLGLGLNRWDEIGRGM